MYCIRAALPHLKKSDGGAIVNITTPGGKASGAGTNPTSMARAAGISMTKSLSKEFAEFNIRVNTVCVGTLKSRQNVRGWERIHATDSSYSLDDHWRARGEGIPLGRVGEAHEAGDVVCFLVSETRVIRHRSVRERRRRCFSRRVTPRDRAWRPLRRHRGTDKLTRRSLFIGVGKIGTPMAERLIAAGHNSGCFRQEPGTRLSACPVPMSRVARLSRRRGRSLRHPAYLPARARLNSTTCCSEKMPWQACSSAGLDPRRSHHQFPCCYHIGGRTTRNPAGVSLIDAPVSGGVEGARTGDLTALVGGRRKQTSSAFDHTSSRCVRRYFTSVRSAAGRSPS